MAAAAPVYGTETAALSLLSLAMPPPDAAAAAAAPDALAVPAAGLSAGAPAGSTAAGANAALHTGLKHRRLSSTGQTRRRLSEARDAVTRPSLAMLQASPAAAMAALTLSTSPPAHGGAQPMSIPGHVRRTLSAVGLEEQAGAEAKPASGKGSGKKRAQSFVCESCSKVYKHPSCLIKHRWEHSPHWNEASKFVLSKHQQVQLLEAAAILSHMSTANNGSSLPEDRAFWPNFLSPDKVPPPSVENTSAMPTSAARSTTTPVYAVKPTSSSVPAASLLSGVRRASSTGPKMHDYALPPAASTPGGLTQLRPGLLGVPTGAASASGTPSPSSSLPAVPLAMPHAGAAHPFAGYRQPLEPRSFASERDAWGSPGGAYSASYRSTSGGTLAPAAARGLVGVASLGGASASTGTGGWSLPRSDVRSSSGSRSRSGSLGSEYVDVEEMSALSSVQDVGELEMSFDCGEHQAAHGWRRGRHPTTVKEEEEAEEASFEVLHKKPEGDWANTMDMDMD